MTTTIGLDIGGTKVLGVVLDAYGQVVREERLASPHTGLEALVATGASIVKQLDAEGVAVGVGAAGLVDRQGIVRYAPNLPNVRDAPLREALAAATGHRVVVDNDASVATLGEVTYGAAVGRRDVLLVTLGTGIGGGLVLGHQLYPGANGFAAEVGHMKVDSSPDAPLCACGQRGCVETFAGTRALLREYARQGGHASEVLPIAVSARRGEPAGVKTFEMMGTALGRLLANIQNLLDLNAVVFSGGISASFDLLEPFVRGALRAQAFSPPLAEVPLLVSELGERAGVIGAAHLTTL